MDWPLIGIIAIGAGALVAFFAMGRPTPAKVLPDRKIQGFDVLNRTPAPPLDRETARQFIEAMNAQS